MEVPDVKAEMFTSEQEREEMAGWRKYLRQSKLRKEAFVKLLA